MGTNSAGTSSEEECVAGWRPVHVDRSGRSLWHVQGVGDSTTDIPKYVKRYAARDPYEREARALQQMPDGLAPRVLEHHQDPPTLVLEDLPGVMLDDPAAGDPAAWMHVVMETVVASVGLPGPWPDDPPPQISGPQAEVAAALAARVPASSRALHVAIEDPLRVPCHGDATPPNVLVDPGQPRAWLLDYEFYGPGDPLHDIAALCLTPSLTLPEHMRLDFLRKGRLMVEAKTGLDLASRMAGAIAVWAAQCAAWHRRQRPVTDGFEQAVLSNAALGIEAVERGEV
ncbi:phosphotransferase family protein [Streptomyces sp. NPDC018833]|uniref:phosphotransferase family protein n=1 Tax=Streptomyces sp. NPDC018833 TaxID=3365053 RepID=UPI0037B9D4A1